VAAAVTQIMTFTAILTRTPIADLSGGELTHLAPASIDGARAGAQHNDYCMVMARYAPLITLPPLAGKPDAVFVEDALLALPEAFVLLRSGALSRRDEPAALVHALPTDRPVLRLEPPATVDGGDLLRIGKQIFVGLTSRTNRDGVAALDALLSPIGYAVKAVELTDALHLKTAVTAIAPDLLLLNPAWVPITAFSACHHIACDPAEPFSGNSLTLGSVTYLSASHPRTADRIRAAGFEVELLDVSEFAKMEAGLTCMSVPIPKATVASA
jgi:dimethylargininase